MDFDSILNVVWGVVSLLFLFGVLCVFVSGIYSVIKDRIAKSCVEEVEYLLTLLELQSPYIPISRCVNWYFKDRLIQAGYEIALEKPDSARDIIWYVRIDVGDKKPPQMRAKVVKG